MGFFHRFERSRYSSSCSAKTTLCAASKLCLEVSKKSIRTLVVLREPLMQVINFISSWASLSSKLVRLYPTLRYIYSIQVSQSNNRKVVVVVTGICRLKIVVHLSRQFSHLFKRSLFNLSCSKLGFFLPSSLLIFSHIAMAYPESEEYMYLFEHIDILCIFCQL